jgi:hypothetical protein
VLPAGRLHVPENIATINDAVVLISSKSVAGKDLDPASRAEQVAPAQRLVS